MSTSEETPKPQYRENEWFEVGRIGVDAGLCWIGDPCYILHKDNELPKELGADWLDFCHILQRKEEQVQKEGKPRAVQWNYDLGHAGLGVTTETGWGDGEYPVYVKVRDGRVAEVRVVFDEEGADEE